MQWDLSEVLGYRIHARDGSLGTVTDLYVDDVWGRVRYLVVTEAGPSGARQFLLAPEAIRRIDREIGWLFVFLSLDAVHNSPEVGTGQHLLERDASRLRKLAGLPGTSTGLSLSRKATLGRPRLRSLKELLGCCVLVADGTAILGALVKLVFDDRTWIVHNLEVDTSCRLPASRGHCRSDDSGRACRNPKRLTLTLPRLPVWIVRKLSDGCCWKRMGNCIKEVARQATPRRALSATT